MSNELKWLKAPTHVTYVCETLVACLSLDKDHTAEIVVEKGQEHLVIPALQAALNTKPVSADVSIPLFAHNSLERNALEDLYQEKITVSKCVELIREGISKLLPESPRPYTSKGYVSLFSENQLQDFALAAIQNAQAEQLLTTLNKHSGINDLSHTIEFADEQADAYKGQAVPLYTHPQSIKAIFARIRSKLPKSTTYDCDYGQGGMDMLNTVNDVIDDAERVMKP